MKPWLIGGLVVALGAGAIGVSVLLQDGPTEGAGAADVANNLEQVADSAPDLPAPASGGRDAPQPLTPAESVLPDVAAAGAGADPAAALVPGEFREPLVLTGRVLDEGGRPIEGASVRFLPDAFAGLRARDRGRDPVGEPDVPSAVTGRDGRFRLEASLRLDEEQDLPIELLGAGRQLVVRHDRFATLARPLANLQPPAWDVGDLYMEPGAWLSGRAVDVAGRPVAGAEVTARTQTDEGRGGRRPGFAMMVIGGGPGGSDVVTTAADGRFIVRGLKPGIASVTVQKTGLRLAVKDGVVLQPLQGADVGDVVLETGALISGVVLDDRGAPIAGASVSVSSMARLVLNRIEDLPREQIGQEFGQRATTDADGRFEIGGLGGGTYTVHASAEGYDVLSREDVPAGTRDLRLVPVRLGALLLRVRGGAEPVDGAVVAATPRSSVRWFRSGSNAPVLVGAEALEAAGRSGDPEGVYLVQHAGLQGTDLVLAAEGYARQAVDGPAVPSGQIVELPVDLEPEAVVSGVVQGADGQPIPRAYVRLGRVEPQQDGFEVSGGRGTFERAVRIGGDDAPSATRQSTRTAADGTFALRGVSAGAWELSARAQGYVPGPRQPLDVTQPGAQEDIVLVLEPAGAVVGTVTERDGTPVAGAQVSVAPVAAAATPAADDGWGGRGGRGARGGQMMRAMGFGGPGEGGGRRVRTGADGRYRADGLAPGDYTVSLLEDPLRGGAFGGAFLIAIGADGAEGEQPDAYATVLPGQDTRVDLVAPEPGTVGGRVTAGGRPAAGITVTMRAAGALPFGGRTAETDASGVFTFTDVTEGEYTLSAIVPGAAVEERADVELAAGESRSVDLVFAGSTLAGRVVQEGTDIGVEGLTITAAPMRAEQGGFGEATIALEFMTRESGGGPPRGMSMTVGGGPISSVRTDSEGRFELLYMEPGTWRIEAGGAGYVRAVLEKVEVADGENRDDLRLSVRRGAVVHGVVTDGKTGARLNQVPVRLNGPAAREMTVTEDGRYRFEGLDSGEYTISVLGSGFGSEAIASESLALEVGEDRALDLKTEG